MKAQEREGRVDELLAEGLAAEDGGGRWLVAGRLPATEAALAARGAACARWTRFAARGEAPPSLVPPGEGYDGAVLRLPRGAEATEMALHLIASRLAPHGELWVAGPNDEGIRSAPRKIEAVLERVIEQVPGGHARRIRAAGPRPGLRAAADDWATTAPLALPTVGERPWVTFPGVFAAGRVDTASALLLAHLPDLQGKRVLDFGCGAGVLSAVLAARGARVTACDHDVYAVEAARRNLGPDVEVICADGLPADGAWDAVVSNPPIHAGQERDLGVIRRLAEELPARIAAGGAVYWVTQVTVPMRDLVGAAFPDTRAVASDRSFTVARSLR
jgi:16S rRNA (guanine1207-N2)-methyltransferase